MNQLNDQFFEKLCAGPANAKFVGVVNAFTRAKIREGRAHEVQSELLLMCFEAGHDERHPYRQQPAKWWRREAVRRIKAKEERWLKINQKNVG